MPPPLIKKTDTKHSLALRIKRVCQRLAQLGLDGLIVSLPANITYLTGSPGRDSYLLISKNGNFYFTDSRYFEESKETLDSKMTRLVRINGSVFKLLSDSCIEAGLKKVGFEGRCMPFLEYKRIKENLGRKAVLVPLINLIEQFREIKEREEIEKIREATAITSSALEFISGLILPGKKEIEVVAELEHFIRYHGASDSAFAIIVASGPNSSYPHHIPGQRRIKDNEVVLVDIGVEHLGYKSDLTRVFFLGKINILIKKIYRIVLQAQNRALEKIKPSTPISALDKIARQYIAEEGYGGFFGHNLGHGIGLDVHEEPHICDREDRLLKPGMVFTIEPAIYLPGRFGIRIEDIVLVNKKGCEVLSGSLNK